VAELKIKTPYSQAARLVAAIPGWLNEYDAQRLASYQLYEDIYWTVKGTFKLTQRGAEENPIYLPSGRIIVNTMNRYVGKDWDIAPDPLLGSDPEKEAALAALRLLFKRERMRSTFKGAKKFGLIRGDWAFYITANPFKPQGSRISIKSIDPGMMFPITDDNDVDRIIGYSIVEQVPEGDKVYIHKTRYLKSLHPEHPNFVEDVEQPDVPIAWDKVVLEQDNWETPEAKVIRTETPMTLIVGITNLPIYHIKNGDVEPGNPFGSSEMRGLERVMAALNQSITDEELALALEGLGMYTSGKGQPVNATGQPVPWQLGPGKVVHDDTFKRVQGVSSVSPFTEHMKFLKGEMYEASGTNDVSRGIVDVTTAESGIALALRMGPIIGDAEERDTHIQEVMDNLLFDLGQWMSVYEQVNFGEAVIVSTFGPKLPENKDAEVKTIISMATATPPLISAGTARTMLKAKGYDFPDNEGVNIIEEMMAIAEAADTYGSRLGEEEAGASDTPPEDDAAADEV
jgi:hypothetical protein